jgi:hypothetical protein
MKFNLGPRNAEFGTFNNRAENHGDAKVKAIDLPVKIAITMKELDMIVPLQTGKFSEVIYDKKKNLQTFVLSPMYVSRKPEKIAIQIWDHETDDKKVLVVKDTKVKDPTIVFEDKGVMYLTFKVQISSVSTKDLDRIIDNIENKTRKFKCIAEAPELPFGEDDGEDGEGSDEATEGAENDKGE